MKAKFALMLHRLSPHGHGLEGIRPSAGGRTSIEHPRRRFAVPFLAAAATVIIGVALGLVLTFVTTGRDSDIGAVHVGAWSVWPGSGTLEADPYQRARFARTGQIPLAAAEGMLFLARTDDSGRRLSRDCRYDLSGPVPQARFWTLDALGEDGFPLDNSAKRFAFTSSDLLRQADGRFAIALSPQARPGNWLPLTGHGAFTLVLRLYDTPVTVFATKDIRALALPSIVPRGCP